MSITTMKDGNFFKDIPSGQICPICGKKNGRCSLFFRANGKLIAYVCHYIPSEKKVPSNPNWYFHFQTNELSSLKQFQKEIIEKENRQISEEEIILRNLVYREFRSLVRKYTGSYLNLKDKTFLIKRGISPQFFDKMNLFSFPENDKIRKQIINDLFRIFGDKLITVSGFYESKGEIKTKYVKGFFIPYVDFKGRIVFMQYRLREEIIVDEKKIRYLTFSDRNSRSGVSIHNYCPTYIDKDNVFLITEGALKGMVASEKLKIKGFYMSGAGMYKKLVNEIKNYISYYQLNKEKIYFILALDMDKYQNKQIKQYEEKIIEMFKNENFHFYVAEWNQKYKDIEDCLYAKEKIYLSNLGKNSR